LKLLYLNFKNYVFFSGGAKGSQVPAKKKER